MPNTRERLAEAAANRFYKGGFRNVGLDQVLDDVGISKTAFYKHFDCKEDLVLAALEMKGRWIDQVFRETVGQRGGDTPAGRLRAIFDVVEMLINSDEFQGCFFVNAALEYPLPHEPAHLVAARQKEAIEAFVRELASEAGAADPAQLARELCLIMEGAYVTRQLTGNKQSVTIARRIADLVLAAHLPGEQ